MTTVGIEKRHRLSELGCGGDYSTRTVSGRRGGIRPNHRKTIEQMNRDSPKRSSDSREGAHAFVIFRRDQRKLKLLKL